MLYLDLEKAKLNTSRLVKKPVQVRGKDGKIHTRMQWVDPNKGQPTQETFTHDEVDVNGKPTQNTEPPEEIMEKLNLNLELKDHTGNPERSKEVRDNPVMELVNESGVAPVDVWDSISDEIDEFLSAGSSVSSTTSNASTAVHARHWKKISEALTTSINDNAPDLKTKNTQLGALKHGDMKHYFSVGAHPDIAKQFVNKMIGEEKANILRGHMEDANLTVNFSDEYLESIMEEGYIASTDETYAKNNLSESEYERYMEHKESGGSIYDLADISYDLYERADAEQEAIGLFLEDDKPTYIAFNPFNNPTGGTAAFGNSWFKLNDPEDILTHSTVTIDDSFVDTASFAKVFNMDHLKDIFIIKSLFKNTDYDWDGITEDSGTEWGLYRSDIALELQYHKPKLEPSQFDIQMIAGDLVDDDFSVEDYNSTKEDYDDLDDLDFPEDDLEWEDYMDEPTPQENRQEIDALEGVSKETKDELKEMTHYNEPEPISSYHSTLLGNVLSILQQGIVPGFQEPAGQSWKGDYHGEGNYLHSMFPEHEMNNFDPSDVDYSPDAVESVIATIQVIPEVDITTENGRRKLVPEEENPLHDQVDNSWIGIASYMEGGPIVYKDSIKTGDIVEITVPDHPMIRGYIESLNLESINPDVSVNYHPVRE